MFHTSVYNHSTPMIMIMNVREVRCAFSSFSFSQNGHQNIFTKQSYLAINVCIFCENLRSLITYTINYNCCNRKATIQLLKMIIRGQTWLLMVDWFDSNYDRDRQWSLSFPTKELNEQQNRFFFIWTALKICFATRDFNTLLFYIEVLLIKVPLRQIPNFS